MQERKGAVTLRGNPMTLVGPELKPGDKAPNFTVIGNDMKPVTLADTAGKARIIASVPSLDTPVCDTETRRFNEEVARDFPHGYQNPRVEDVARLQLLVNHPAPCDLGGLISTCHASPRNHQTQQRCEDEARGS